MVMIFYPKVETFDISLQKLILMCILPLKSLCHTFLNNLKNCVEIILQLYKLFEHCKSLRSKSFQCLPTDFSPFIVIRVCHRPFFVIPTVLSPPYFVLVAAVNSSMWPSLASDTGNTILRRSDGSLAWLVGAHGVGSSKRTNVNVMEGAFYCFSSFSSLNR